MRSFHNYDGKHAEIGPPGKGLPKDEAGNFIASQEKSDVVHDKSKNIREHLPARAFRVPQEESGLQLSPDPNSGIDEDFIIPQGLFRQQCLQSLLFPFR